MQLKLGRKRTTEETDEFLLEQLMRLVPPLVAHADAAEHNNLLVRLIEIFARVSRLIYVIKVHSAKDSSMASTPTYHLLGLIRTATTEGTALSDWRTRKFDPGPLSDKGFLNRISRFKRISIHLRPVYSRSTQPVPSSKIHGSTDHPLASSKRVAEFKPPR